MWRIWGLAALMRWVSGGLSAHGQSMPRPLGGTLLRRRFPGARADAVLGRVLGPERPHPVGSAEAAAVRGRILNELAGMGVAARVQSRMSCVSEARWHQVNCATVTNIIADVLPGAGKPVLLMAHSDSVAAGPGAGDDGSGVAVLLETIRALKARPPQAGLPVTALFSDGEEPGLLGASAYIHEAKDEIAAVVNVDARGNQRPELSVPDQSRRCRADRSLCPMGFPHHATSSLSGEIYKYLPNDTDLTPFAGGRTARRQFRLHRRCRRLSHAA